MYAQAIPVIHDHYSDPAHTPGHGWVDEGGASHLGPATHLQINPQTLAPIRSLTAPAPPKQAVAGWSRHLA